MHISLKHIIWAYVFNVVSISLRLVHFKQRENSCTRYFPQTKFRINSSIENFILWSGIAENKATTLLGCSIKQTNIGFKLNFLQKIIIDVKNYCRRILSRKKTCMCWIASAIRSKAVPGPINQSTYMLICRFNSRCL